VSETRQLPLFTTPTDVRRLTDLERTVLEAIEKIGPLTAREAGRIAFRLRGRAPAVIDRSRMGSAGRRVLEQLERHGWVRPTGRGRWRRVAA
jgi:ribosomal protein S19E (S16A)